LRTAKPSPLSKGGVSEADGGLKNKNGKKEHHPIREADAPPVAFGDLRNIPSERKESPAESGRGITSKAKSQKGAQNEFQKIDANCELCLIQTRLSSKLYEVN
jgi:hypothetical protein